MPAPAVTCVGGAVLDRKYALLAPPVAGTSNPARAVRAFGGVARNVAENLARLGVAVRLVSAVGGDDAGRELCAHAAAAGVDVSGVAVVPGAGTAEYVAVLDPAGELVLGVAAMDVLAAVDAGRVASAWPRAGWVLADANLGPPALAAAVDRARAPGPVRLAVDVVSVAKAAHLPADLHGVDVLFCNLDEARAVVRRAGSQGDQDGGQDGRQDAGPDGGPAEPARLARAVLATGAAAVVLTRGPAGALVADRDGVRTVPAVPAAVVDVTGAGDALVAGTLAGLATGLPLDVAVGRGTLVAALTVAGHLTVRPDLAQALARAPDRGGVGPGGGPPAPDEGGRS